MSSKIEVYRHLRELRDHLTPPPGLAWPEISRNQIVMMMSPRPRHQLTAARLVGQLRPQLAAGLIAAEATDTEQIELGTLRVPDVIVVPVDAMDTDDPLDPREILLAVEVVSPSNPENDYRNKARDYPAMGIPHYLIVDPRDGSCTYFHGIGTGCGGTPEYENRQRSWYGDRLTVAGWEVDTGDFPRYSEKDMNAG
jgi:Uma2 family endonuclease